MRLLRSAYSGFLADQEMIGYWRFRDSVATVANSGLAQNPQGRPLLPLTGAGQAAVGFNPSLVQGAIRFNGLTAYASSAPLIDTNLFATSFLGQRRSIAVAYDFSDVTASGTVLELGSVPGGGSTNAALKLSLGYSATSKAFTLAFQTSTGSTRSQTAFDAPLVGLMSVDLATDLRDANWYYNGRYATTTTLSGSGVSNSVSGASTRWIVGGSVFTGTAYNAPTHFISNGVISEIAVWRRGHNPEKHAELYASISQPWDDEALIKSKDYKAVVQVKLQDAAGVMQNLSDFDGADWVQSVSLEEDVDSPEAKATVTLRRRRGRFADLSPLNTEPDYAGLINLRRKVVISRSLVPRFWNLRGWEARIIFEGLVDSWDMGQDTIELRCTDLSAGLQDAFIADTKAYNYPAAGTSVEIVQQALINEYAPSIGRGINQTVIGYKGLPASPTLYTEAGSFATPRFIPNPQVIRFNDVSSGPVFGALQALADQTGYETRFKFHEPWGEHRLTSSTPRRNKTIGMYQITQVSDDTRVIEFNAPHGLSGLSRLLVTGAGALDSPAVRVKEVLDSYRVSISAASLLLDSFSSAGTVAFGANLTMSAEDVLDVDPVKSDIDRIRNHAIVRYQRNTSVATLNVIGVSRQFDGTLIIDVDSGISKIDPDDRGITMSLTGGLGGSGTAASLFGSYTAVIRGDRQLGTNVPSGVVGVPGSYPGTLTYTTPLTVSSEYVGFKEAVSTATASMQEYGLLPVSIYEGSNLGISTQVEAARLADTLISDLATPTVDLNVVTSVLPVGLHDVLRFDQDPKGRWTGTLDAAITSLTEEYRSGDCFSTYGLRFSAPSRGTRWIIRVMVTLERPAPSATYDLDMVNQAAKWKIRTADLGRTISIRRPLPERREMGMRHDQTEIWLSTLPDFVPSEQNRVGMFRGENIDLTMDATGETLAPGVTYYARFADRDIFGNLSDTTGLNTASAATTPAFTVRYLALTQGALAVRASTSVYTADWSGFTPLFLNIDDGSDNAGRSFDNFSGYSTTSGLFRAQCDGFYAANSEFGWLGTKSSGAVSARVGRFTGGMATVGYSRITTSSFSGAATRFRVSLNETVYCNSGDFLRVEWDPSSTAAPILASTTSAAFGYVAFALVNQS